MIKIILFIGVALMVWSSSSMARPRLAVGACVSDIRKLCPAVQPGNDRLRSCVIEHIKELSYPCLVTLAKFVEVSKVLKECRAHIHQRCATVPRGGGRFGACLRSAVASLSDNCKDALTRALPGLR
jgi:hypothetical protein